MESAGAMLYHSNLPKKFWAEAIATAAYLRNRTTTSANDELLTPFEKWYGYKPNISHLKVFGCTAYSHIPPAERKKLDQKAKRMVFVGYSKNPKGYRLFDVTNERVITRRDVAFNEIDFQFSSLNEQDSSSTTELLVESEVEDDGSEPATEEPLRRSQRTVRFPNYYGYDSATLANVRKK